MYPCARLPSASLFVLMLVGALPRPSLAQPSPEGVHQVAEPARSDAWTDVTRPWLYASDPTAPPPGRAMATLSVGYAQLDRGAARPFAADIAHAGAVFQAGAEVGVVRFLSVHAEGLLAGQGSSERAKIGGMLGVSAYLLPNRSRVALAVSAGYLRELGGAHGAWGRISAAAQAGQARFIVTVLGSHLFEQGRDALDVVLTAGATYTVVPSLRLGVEYTVQDLEGALEDDESDGGIRHFLGPTASLELTKRVRLTAGPAFGLSKDSPTVLGRIAAAYAF